MSSPTLRIWPESAKSIRIGRPFPRESGRLIDPASARPWFNVDHGARRIAWVKSATIGWRPYHERWIPSDNLKLFRLAPLSPEGRAARAVQAPDRPLPAPRTTRYVHVRLAGQQLGRRA